jgi:hypothetical protein
LRRVKITADRAGRWKLSVFFFKLNNGNIQLFEQKNFKSKLENEKLTFIFVIFDIPENNLGKNIFVFMVTN